MKMTISNKTLIGRLLLTASVALALIGSAHANLELIDTVSLDSQNTAAILAATGEILGETEVIDLLRIEEGAFAPDDSPFIVSYPTANTAQISWDLNGSGFDLAGIYVFGGGSANVYQVTDAAQMVSGTALVNAPFAGGSGQFADISHTVFIGTVIPEPSTIALMFCGIAALVGVQRLRRRRF